MEEVRLCGGRWWECQRTGESEWAPAAQLARMICVSVCLCVCLHCGQNDLCPAVIYLPGPSQGKLVRCLPRFAWELFCIMTASCMYRCCWCREKGVTSHFDLCLLSCWLYLIDETHFSMCIPSTKIAAISLLWASLTRWKEVHFSTSLALCRKEKSKKKKKKRPCLIPDWGKNGDLKE